LLPFNLTLDVQSSVIKSIQEQVSRLEIIQNLAPAQTDMPVNEKADNVMNLNKESYNNRFSLTDAILGFYLLIALVLFVRFALQLVQLSRLLKGNETKVIDGVVYHTTDKPLPPFSFFRHLVISKSQFENAQIDQIIAHEKVHIRQWHMIDILLSELLQALLWINPFVWAINRYVKLNLEYIADEDVLSTGVDRMDYQMNILTSCLNPREYDLANLFNSSKIKLRIKMMNEKRASFVRLYKYGFIVPLLLLTYIAINAATIINGSAPEMIGPRAIPDNNGNIYLSINAATSKRIIENIEINFEERGIEFTMNSIKRNKKNLITFIDCEIGIPGIPKMKIKSGNGSEPLLHPAAYFYELGKGTAFTEGEIPASISHIGKLIIKDNLNGLIIIDRNGFYSAVGFTRYYGGWKY
jgi:hypothetical protein